MAQFLETFSCFLVLWQQWLELCSSYPNEPGLLLLLFLLLLFLLFLLLLFLLLHSCYFSYFTTTLQTGSHSSSNPALSAGHGLLCQVRVLLIVLLVVIVFILLVSLASKSSNY